MPKSDAHDAGPAEAGGRSASSSTSFAALRGHRGARRTQARGISLAAERVEADLGEAVPIPAHARRDRSSRRPPDPVRREGAGREPLHVGRAFIPADQELQQQRDRLKFNPLDEIAGKRISDRSRRCRRQRDAAAREECRWTPAPPSVRISWPLCVGPVPTGMRHGRRGSARRRGPPLRRRDPREHVGATSLYSLRRGHAVGVADA